MRAGILKWRLEVVRKSLGLVLFFVSASTISVFAETGIATIIGTSAGSEVSGEVKFEDTAEGLKVGVQVENVLPGKHGFHIHQYGLCQDEGKAAGGHYNPEGAGHGFVMKDGFSKAHAGDFGNIEVGPDGKGSLETVIPGLTLSNGTRNAAGRAVILHEKEDDFGQPTGNAGGRIGCGQIVIAGD